MEAAPPTRGVDGAGARLCTCGNKISSKDPHRVCSSCLGLEHAQLALEVPGSCESCACFTLKSLRRRLARQASLSGKDPCLPAPGPPPGDASEHVLPEPVPCAELSWGSQLELAGPSHPAEDVLELDYGDDEDTSELLISEEDEEDDVFLPIAQASMPSFPSSPRDGAASPAAHLDMQSVCRRAATRLNIPWPTVVTEAVRSRYEGKKLPQATRAAKPLLPAFPELLQEVRSSWDKHPFSSRSPVQGASSLDFEGMEKAGMLRMPPMEPLVAAHLHPRLSATSSRPPALPAKADRFQSALNERAYKAAAISVRALNVSSMLSAYQAELCEDMNTKPDPEVWEEITVLTDICLRVQRCAVQATAKAMGMMVLQERARWLNLTNLSDREKEDILDMPIVPEGIFGSALASMQQRCEAKKKKDETLQLCLPPFNGSAGSAEPSSGSCQSPASVPDPKAPEASGSPTSSFGLSASTSLASEVRQPSHSAAGTTHPTRRSAAPPVRCCHGAFSPPSRNPSGRIPERSRVGPGRATGCAGSEHTSQALTLFFTNMSRSRSIKKFAAASRQNVKGAAKINKNVTHERFQAGAAPGGLSSQPRVVPVCQGRQSTKPPRMRSGCHEHRCPTTSGGSCCSVCHGCVTALHSHGGMDSGFCFTLGAENYFERYFLVPKRGGTSIRPILDLRALNRCLRKYRFKMLTLSSLLRLIHQNDWFTSIDLRDAYFHIPVYPPHRKFLRFAFQGVCYEYTVLPFGLSLSPRVFVRCLNLDSGAFTARLSAPRMNALSFCLARFRLHSSENAQCPLFFSLRDRDAPLGVDALAHDWPRGLLYAFPPVALIPPTLLRGPGVPSGRLDLPPSSRTAGPVGLAPEGCGLVSAELPQAVIRTIQNARAPSTRSLYDCKWRVFEAWCQGREISPFQCPVSVILSFLQDLLDGKKAFSTIKVYLAAISARHLGFGKKLAGQHPLVCSFMRGARRLLPVSRPLVPSWDLSLVLSALSGPPFEPMDGLDLKILSLKVVLLLALVSAKRVSDLQALSVHPSCTQFAPGDMKVSLKPNPAFVPKVVGSFSPIILTAFYPLPFSSPEEERWHKLCPIRALKEYVNRTENLRRGDQLFVSWGGPRKGKPVTKQRLSHWIVEAISMAYSCQGIQAPVGLRAHSTRGLSASWALFRGLSIQEICAAASWASPLAFARFYKLDVSVPAMTHTILSVGSLAGQDVSL
uniref:ribonuclease H n=1 Tax=Nothobranchius rachovii TaxID=451742 RepID=A0A1A8PZ04_9TELE